MKRILTDVAHGLWQSVPHRLRRRLLDEALLRLMHRPGAAGPIAGPWVVAGALRAPTGLGEAARLAVAGLQRLGEPVSVVDLTDMLRQNPVLPAPSAPVAGPGGGTVLVFVQPPLSTLALRAIGRERLVSRRLVAHWVWERERVPATWAAHARGFHEVVAPTRFAAGAVAQVTGGAVRVVPYPVAASGVPERQEEPGRPFTVGFVGDMVAAADRKNPLGAVEAFVGAGLRSPAARLRLHLHGARTPDPALVEAIRAACADGFDIILDQAVRSEEEVKALYGAMDLYLSLHRAEGFGLTLAEAMLAAVPVVATDWSSTAEFVDETVGYPVPARLVPAPLTVDETSPQRWADPDPALAAAAIRAAHDDPEGRRALGRNARERILSRFSPEAFLGSLLDESPPAGAASAHG